jgi:hypothetical protein
VNGLSGVKRAKEELGNVKCGVVTSQFFHLKDTNKRLDKRLVTQREDSNCRNGTATAETGQQTGTQSPTASLNSAN